MGLATLGIEVPSTNTTGSILQPVNNGPAFTEFYGIPGHTSPVPAYKSYAIVNQSSNQPGGSVAPSWGSGDTSPGDVIQNDGRVGLNEQIFGGNAGISQSAAGMNVLQQFSASSATYSKSTEFFRGLVYQALTPGTVTLAPFADTSATQYWSVETPAASNGGITGYKPAFFNSNDTFGTLPVLVINVYTVEPPHSVVSLSASPPTGYGTSSGILSVTGGNGKYSLAQITGLNDVTNYVAATGWNPSTDEEIFGLDVLVNGTQATGAQLATLIDAIGGDGVVPASTGVDASTTNPGNLFPSGYNLFLTIPGGGPAGTDYLAIDLSNSGDSNLVGYSFASVAAIPEPASAALIAVSAVGALAQRRRRKG
jgi:hypothetical protein